MIETGAAVKKQDETEALKVGGRYFSLKWGILGIVLACWVLPIVIIIAALGYYITNNVARQISYTVSTSVENAAMLANTRLDSAVMASRAASYNPVLRRAYKENREKSDPIRLFNTVTDFLDQQYKDNDKFLATMLFFCDDPDMVYYTFSSQTDTKYAQISHYRERIHEQVKALAPILDTDIVFLSVDGSLFMVRDILDANDRFNPYAVLVMELNIPVMFDGFYNVLWESRSTIWLDGAELRLKDSGFEQRQMPVPLAPSEIPPEGILTVRSLDTNDTLVQGGLRGNGYTLSYAVDVDSTPLVDEFLAFRKTLVGMLLLIIPLFALAIRFLYIHISKPTGALMAAAGKIEAGKFGIHVGGRCANREFAYLFRGFNSMSDRLQYQFERIYREELALRDARIMALQSQINPHFLNNTLEIINWEARMADDIKVSQMIEALSTMLDAAMDRKGKPTVHLGEEMMYVDAYLYIISERLGKRLTVKKEIDPKTLDLFVPRLVMQPVIENAVEHGIQPKQRGTITIRTYIEEEQLILEVENDGVMTPEDEERAAQLLSPDYDAAGENSYHLGIRNVNQRLRILYGEGSGLTIRMSSSGGALAKIVVAKNAGHQSDQ